MMSDSSIQTSKEVDPVLGVVVTPQTYLNLTYLLLAFPLGLFYFIDSWNSVSFHQHGRFITEFFEGFIEVIGCVHSYLAKSFVELILHIHIMLSLGWIAF
jgi:hypothetical protein